MAYKSTKLATHRNRKHPRLAQTLGSTHLHHHPPSTGQAQHVKALGGQAVPVQQSVHLRAT